MDTFVALRRQKIQVRLPDGSIGTQEFKAGDVLPDTVVLPRPSRWIEAGYIKSAEDKYISRRHEPTPGYTRVPAREAAPEPVSVSVKTVAPVIELPSTDDARVPTPVPSKTSGVTPAEMEEFRTELEKKGTADIKELAAEMKLVSTKKKSELIIDILTSLAAG